MRKISADLSSEEFMRAVTAADFKSLIDSEGLKDLGEFVNRCHADGLEKILIRFFFQRKNEGDVPTPYYMWASYPADASGGSELELFVPDFSDIRSLLDVPEELAGIPYFEIVVGQ